MARVGYEWSASGYDRVIPVSIGWFPEAVERKRSLHLCLESNHGHRSEASRYIVLKGRSGL